MMHDNNVTFELWSIDPLEMLVNNLTAEQLLEAFPVYAHTFGEAVTKAYMVRDNKRIQLDSVDMKYLKVYLGYNTLYDELKRKYRTAAREGNLAEMKRLTSGLCFVDTYAKEAWKLFLTKEWR